MVSIDKVPETAEMAVGVVDIIARTVMGVLIVLFGCLAWLGFAEGPIIMGVASTLCLAVPVVIAIVLGVRNKRRTAKPKAIKQAPAMPIVDAPLMPAKRAASTVSYTPAQSFRQMKVRADAGDPAAQGELAGLYFHGVGVEANARQCFKYAVLSAAKGDAQGQSWLGYCCYKGIGTTPDAKKALAMFKMAAAQGDATAQGELAELYFHGRGTERNSMECFRYAELSAAQGDPRGQNWLAYCYLVGAGTVPDAEKAAGLFKASAEQGYVKSELAYGGMLEQGTGGLTKDEEAAFTWYLRAADQGDPVGLLFVGMCLINGVGTVKDAKRGRMVLEASATKGNRRAEKWLEEHPID